MMTRLPVTIPLFCMMTLSVVSLAAQADEARSGYEYIKPDTRAMQDDDFANPGLLAVDAGQDLFNSKQEGASRACAQCHGEDGEGLDAADIARYPRYDKGSGEIVSLQTQISRCRGSTGSEPLPANHPDLVALETFVRHLSFGEPVNVQTDDQVTGLLQEGEKLYNTRYGLIDMSCYQCHVLYTGQMIRGQKISQGQANGFPAYRLDIGEMTNLNQRIQQCLTLMRAEPFDTDSREMRLLELYIMSRSNGLKIETPAVRY